MDTAVIEILTERLILRPLVVDDATALFSYRSDASVRKHHSWETGSLDEVHSFILGFESLDFDVPGSWFQLGVRFRESNRLMGDLGVHFLADDPCQVEIGFTVAPSEQGRGIGTEAVKGLLGHLFGVLQKHRVTASVDPDNGRSC